MAGVVGVLIPSPHVTDSRTLNPVSWTCLIWFLVFHSFSFNKLWWRLLYFIKT